MSSTTRHATSLRACGSIRRNATLAPDKQEWALADLSTLTAILAALVAWASLALQFGLLVSHPDMAEAGIVAVFWRFLGYFTILTNTAVAVVATAMAVRPHTALASPRARLATAVAIALVGLVYSLALRAVWNPTGWQAVADHALHDVTPPVFLLAWALSSHGELAWQDALHAILPPFAYCLYAFVRGAADGWYAYWFLNPEALGPAGLAVSIAVLLSAFLLVALSLIALDRWLARRDSTPSVSR